METYIDSSILPADQMASFKEHGFAIIRKYLPEDCLSLADGIMQDWHEEQIRQWIKEGLIGHNFSGVDLRHRLFQAWLAAGKPNFRRDPQRNLINEKMFRLLKHPALVGLAEQLLETPDVYVHGIFNARLKFGGQAHTATPWHQDGQLWNYHDKGERQNPEKKMVLTVWFPLYDSDVRNGGLRLASYQDCGGKCYPVHEHPYHGGIAPEITQSFKNIDSEMKRGDVLCLMQLTPHCALENKTDSPLLTFDIRYESPENLTDSGQPRGFLAQCKSAPEKETPCKEWLDRLKS